MPHALPNVTELEDKVFACSAFKFCAPGAGVLLTLLKILDELIEYKVRPCKVVPPYWWEQGNLPFELSAGMDTSVEYLADLSPVNGTRCDQLSDPYRRIEN